MGEKSSNQTYYEVLEILPTAGPTDIFNAYQRARTTYSPTSPALYTMFSPEEAQQLLALIEEAYQTLSHQARRRDYDVKLGLREPLAVRSTKQEPPQKYSAEDARKKIENNWIGPVKVHKSLQKKDDLPSGFARTKFSVYEINADLEREILSIEECDGQFLQRIRQYKGVSIEQMSEEIRTTKTTLGSLEGNHLDALPVAVFTRGFVVNYGRALGVNEKKLTDAYMKYFKANKK